MSSSSSFSSKKNIPIKQPGPKHKQTPSLEANWDLTSFPFTGIRFVPWHFGHSSAQVKAVWGRNKKHKAQGLTCEMKAGREENMDSSTVEVKCDTKVKCNTAKYWKSINKSPVRRIQANLKANKSSKWVYKLKIMPTALKTDSVLVKSLLIQLHVSQRVSINSEKRRQKGEAFCRFLRF